MTLIATWVFLLAGLSTFLWGSVALAQRTFYDSTADRMALRALVAGMLLATYFTFWTYLHSRAHPGTEDSYGTVFTFSPAKKEAVDSFTAIREVGKPSQRESIRFQKRSQGRPLFVDEDDKPYRLNGAGFLTVEIVLNRGGKELTLTGERDADGNYLAERKFVAPTGEWLDGRQPEYLIVAVEGSFLAAIFLHVGLIVVWFLALGPILRLQMGHAVIGTIIGGVLSLLPVLPLLFERNHLNETARALAG